MFLEIVTNINQFRAIKKDWNALLKKSNSRSVFLTWEWLYYWWLHFGQGNNLFILLGKNKETHRIEGIAPFYITKRKAFNLVNVKIIKFLGSKHVGSDFLDFIILPGKESSVIRLWTEFLRYHKEKWDLIEISDIENNSISLDLLKKYFGQGLNYIERKTQKCPYLKINGDFNSFFSTLSPNMRSSLRRRTRTLEEKYKVSFSKQNSEEELSVSLQKLFSLHRNRFAMAKKSITSQTSFTGKRIENFHKDVAKYLYRQGWIEFYFLNVGDSSIACLYAFKFKDRFFYYQSGFDSRWSVQSPGLVLLGYCLREAIKEKFSEFHYLRGDESYKKRWTEDFKETITVTICNSSLNGITQYLFLKTKLSLKKLFKES